MILAFELSMPGRASWDGEWSGEGRPYIIIRSRVRPSKAAELLERGYYSYGWSDGWRAGIHVRQVDGKEARRLRRLTDGFCGYDWMVDSILEHGGIYASSDEIPAEKDDDAKGATG